MKKITKILLIIIPILLIAGIIYYVFREIEPIDDTKKLYISCKDINDNYDILSGTQITYAKDSKECKLTLEVRNVEREYLKVKSSSFFYKLNGNNEIDEDTLSKDIFVLPTEKLVLYSQDKQTKFEFEYK